MHILEKKLKKEYSGIYEIKKNNQYFVLSVTIDSKYTISY